MSGLRAVLLMPSALGAWSIQLAAEAGLVLDAKVVNDLSSLLDACEEKPALLLSFGTGVIVPSSLLNLPGLLALNVHAASPAYPGRDPHLFAIYDGAKKYGATMHHMTASVDAGPIVDVELFDVQPGATPAKLLEAANSAGCVLIKRFFAQLKVGNPPERIDGLCWGLRKSTRRMFLEMCKVDSTLSVGEFNRRLMATAMPGYNNLYIELHGHRFLIQGQQ
jgi:methionyl-tRNA formyltransferase